MNHKITEYIKEDWYRNTTAYVSGANIAKIRKVIRFKNLSLKNLADKSECHHQTIHSFLSGSRIPKDIYARICEQLDLPFELISVEEDPTDRENSLESASEYLQWAGKYVVVKIKKNFDRETGKLLIPAQAITSKVKSVSILENSIDIYFEKSLDVYSEIESSSTIVSHSIKNATQYIINPHCAMVCCEFKAENANEESYWGDIDAESIDLLWE